jgi:hypothetical protein
MSRKFYDSTKVVYGKANRSTKVLDKQGFEEIVRDAIGTCPLIKQDDARFSKFEKYEVSIDVELAFGVNASLDISNGHFCSYTKGEGTFCVDASGESCEMFEKELMVVINWSSCRKSVNAAALAVRLYGQMVEVAEMVNAIIEDYTTAVLVYEEK